MNHTGPINRYKPIYFAQDKKGELASHWAEVKGIQTKITLSVAWRFPEKHKFKCNINGVCQGNSGVNTLAFYIQDDKGDLFFTRWPQIQKQKPGLFRRLWSFVRRN